jgi:hypothetical protein
MYILVVTVTVTPLKFIFAKNIGMSVFTLLISHQHALAVGLMLQIYALA